MRRLRQLRSLSPREIATATHALVVMTAVEGLVRVVRLPRVARVLGVPLSLDAVEQTEFDPATVLTLPLRTRRQLWAADRVAVRWPFSEGPCLRRALVGGHLIRRHGPMIRLGVDTTADGPLGHAWLEIDGAPLEDIADLTTFTRPTRSDDR